jgi:hypothetical protein
LKPSGKLNPLLNDAPTCSTPPSAIKKVVQKLANNKVHLLSGYVCAFQMIPYKSKFMPRSSTTELKLHGMQHETTCTKMKGTFNEKR